MFCFRAFFTLLIILSISSNTFAIIIKYPVKLGTEEALNAFSIAEKEFEKGQKFQNKQEFENALLCYVKSLESCPTNEGYLNLAYCFCETGSYLIAERMALAGLLSAQQKSDSKNYFSFLALLGNIYFESENFKRALAIYEYLAELPIDEESLNLINKRIGKTLFKIVNP